MEITQRPCGCTASADRGPHDEHRCNTHVLSLDRPGDALALVRSTFGHVPPRSLVVMGLQEGSTGGQMRVDLPSEEGLDAVRFARKIAECLAGQEAVPRPRAAVLMLLTDQVPDPAWEGAPEARPHSALMEALCLIFAVEYGVEVLRTWLVGGGSVRDYDCVEASCCPYPGREASALLEEADALRPWLTAQSSSWPAGAHGGPEQMVGEFEAGGLREPGFLQEVARHGDNLADHWRQDSGAADYEVLLAWDSALQITAETGDAGWLVARPEMAAALVTAVGRPVLRDTILPMAAVGFGTALCGHMAHRAAAETGEDPVRAVQWLKRRHGDWLPEDLAAPGNFARVMTEYRRSFLGRTERRPDWSRMDALAELLSALPGCAEGEVLTHLMTLMAWLEWARGRGSAAGALIDRCRELAPENGLARLIGQHMEMGGICPWARVKTHSWSWWRASEAPEQEGR